MTHCRTEFLNSEIPWQKMRTNKIRCHTLKVLENFDKGSTNFKKYQGDKFL